MTCGLPQCASVVTNRMDFGPRRFRTASLVISSPHSLPPHMREGVRELSSLEVPVADRRQGYATGLMHSVTTEADRAGMVLMIIVEPYGEHGIADVTRLQAFYERFGFARIQDAPVLMARQPQRPRIALARAIARAVVTH